MHLWFHFIEITFKHDRDFVRATDCLLADGKRLRFRDQILPPGIQLSQVLICKNDVSIMTLSDSETKV